MRDEPGRSLPDGLRFTRVTAKNWKNFVGLDVPLEPRTFVVGANASGKSNFLDAFRFLHDLVAVGGGFQAAIALRHGISAIRSLAARRDPEVMLSAVLGDDHDGVRWRYEVRFKQGKAPIITMEAAWRGTQQIFVRPDDRDNADPERLTETYLEQTSLNHDYRTIASAFESVRYLHIVPQLVREPERSFGRKSDPFGGDFLEAIARTSKRDRESRLAYIAKALTSALPQMGELTMEPDVRGVWHLRAKYKHWRPPGAWHDEDQFSDGTLRLIGLLWAMLDGTGPLLLEEPELSLHSAVVRELPQMIARMQSRRHRQVLLSTHSLEILGDAGIVANEVLIVEPSSEGSRALSAADDASVLAMLDAGESLATAVTPLTAPPDVADLPLFANRRR